MDQIDIPVPESHYEEIKALRNFNLIYPFNHPLADVIKIDFRIRIVSFDDNEFFELMQQSSEDGQIDPKGFKPLDYKYLDISYIREVMVKDITRKEWINSFGCEGPKDFLRRTKGKPSNYAKVIALRNPNLSLRSFNKEFAEDVRKNR